jgi:hypothetical protein
LVEEPHEAVAQEVTDTDAAHADLLQATNDRFGLLDV